MDLNLARQAGQSRAPEALVRAIKRGDAILARMIADETYLDGATAYSSPHRAAVPLANAAMDLRLPGGGAGAPAVPAATVMANVLTHFEALGLACHALDSSELAWPAELAAEAQRRGYRAVKCEVAALANYISPGAADDVQIIPGRAAYAETRSTFARHMQQTITDDEIIVEQHVSALMDQLDDPRIDVLLARRSRQPVGLATLLTLGNIGIVLDFFTVDAGDDAALRTLADRLIDQCQRAQFEQVIARLSEAESPTRRALLKRLGFSAAAAYERYVLAGQ